ncbi:hypothetical protein ATO67_19060 [Agrobacterium bohemicum]|uniref:Capsule biosynthesis protein n=2 Tax=Agrobacterium bohemicum TaxID=2052828 RepID=A0A135P7X4_9HYPH|nr:hypothetical protein ATO67_19060 [Agrobacterium bohemicum]
MEQQRLKGLAASKQVSKELAFSARKLRFSTSSRSVLFKAVGLRPRVADRLFYSLFICLTFGLLFLPIASSAIYLGYFASDQFESEARFTVRSSTSALGKDQLASVTGIPSAKIAQDTMIVVNYIQSYEMVKALETRGVSVKEIFGNEHIDLWARLQRNASIEEMTEYWRRMTKVSVSPGSGIVSVKVRAFTAYDASLILQHVLSASEAVVNDVNVRIWKDVISTAEENLKHAAAQLEGARAGITSARNRNSLISVESSADLVNQLIVNLEGRRLQLQGRMEAQLSNVSISAPQMKVLKREIESTEKQVEDLKRQLAGRKLASGEPNLADVSQELAQLQLAQNLSELQFASSAKTLEQVRFTSQQQLMYLESFLDPRVPDKATYPKSGLWFIVVVIGSVLSWGGAIGISYLVRSRLAD